MRRTMGWSRWCRGLVAGVSLCAIVLEWRLGVHGVTLAGPTGAARLAAFNESFFMLAAICTIAMLSAWQLKGPPQGDLPAS